MLLRAGLQTPGGPRAGTIVVHATPYRCMRAAAGRLSRHRQGAVAARSGRRSCRGGPGGQPDGGALDELARLATRNEGRDEREAGAQTASTGADAADLLGVASNG